MDKSDDGIIVGLDIGTTKICAVVGEVKESGLIDIIGEGLSVSTGLRKGVVVNIEQTAEAIRAAIDAAEHMAGCVIETVYVGIAGSHIHSTNSHGVIAVKGGEVDQNDIDRAIEAARAMAIPADREVIHILPQEYILDGQGGIADPLGMAGVRLEVRVHIVTGAVSSAQNIIRACQRSNLDVANIALESFASSKAVLTNEEREIGVALVDIGGGTTDIAIFVNDSIKYTDTIPYGGQNLTSDIAYGLRTPLADAENIKTRFGCALAEMVTVDEQIEVPSVGGRTPRLLSRQLLAEICEPRMEEILYLVDQSLERSGCKSRIGAGVVLTGGAATIEGCAELGEQMFNLPTRVGSPLNFGGMKDMVNNPKFSTAVGLLRFGAEQEGPTFSGKLTAEQSETSIFNRLAAGMKRWFKDIS